MFLEGCIEFVSSALILPLCCLNLHNHLIILHCFAYRDCALKTMSWATEGPSCLPNQSQPFQRGGHTTSSAALAAPRERPVPTPFLGTEMPELGSAVGLPAINPCSWAGPRAPCLTHVSTGLAHWPSLNLPGIDFWTPGTLWEPDFYQSMKTAALHYFSSCTPRIRPRDELEHLNSWPDFKCACHDHLPLKLRTCLSVKSSVHPWWKSQTDGFGLEKKFTFQMYTEVQGQIPSRDWWGHGKVQKPLVTVGSLIKELRVIRGKKWFMKSWIRKWVSDADSHSSNESESKGCSLNS